MSNSTEEETVKALNSEEAEEKPSRTQKKKNAQNLQKLGEFLVEMPATEIKNLNIPDEIKNALLVAQSITKHGARKRQLQYIGVLMREIDTAPLTKIIKKISRIKL